MLVAIVASVAVAGCGSSSDDDSAGASTEPIKVGVAMSLTGPFAAIGESETRGIRLAVDEINDRGGIDGRRLEIQTLDDASDPARAATNVRQLIGDGSVAILGPTTGTTLAATIPLTSRQNVLQIVGVGPDFAGADRVPATMFTVPPPVETWVDYASCYMGRTLGAKRVAGLFTPDAVGVTSAELFPAALREAGSELVSSQQLKLDATSTAVQWTKIRDSNADAVLDWATGAVGGLTLRDQKALKVDVPTVGYVSWGLPPVIRLAGDAAEGTEIIAHIAQDDPTPEQRPFVEAFENAYPDVALDHFAAYGYDMVNILATALRADPDAGQQDGQELAQALEDADPVDSVVGTFDFSDEQEDLGAHSVVTASDIELLEVRDGRTVRAAEQPQCS